MTTTNDHHFMQHAIRVGRHHLGLTGERPSVGCVLVKDGQVIASACTGREGKPHAEAAALALAGSTAKGATAYVTLEPCAHHGRTPPCAEALAQAGIQRVVIACQDPNPKVAGQGIAILKEAGIDVQLSVCEAEAAHDLAGFFRHIAHGLPIVTMKLASTADGCMATEAGDSHWITGELARQRGHLLRAQHDAVLTGIGTVLADNPLYTVRLPGLEDRTPIRMVVDRQLRIPLESKLVRTAQQWPLIILTASDDSAKIEALTAQNVTVLPSTNEALSDIKSIVQIIGKRGISRVLVEAGPTLSSAFLEANCVDVLHWFRAPTLLGGDGQHALQSLGVETIEALKTMRVHAQEMLGKDQLTVYELNACLPELLQM